MTSWYSWLVYHKYIKRETVFFSLIKFFKTQIIINQHVWLRYYCFNLSLLSGVSISKSEASKAQSIQDKTGKDLHAPEQQSAAYKNLKASQEATAKGFSTTSNFDEESAKPAPDYPTKIRGN